MYLWVSSHVFSCHFLNRMYDFTFTIVDGVPKIDKREDLSHDLNEQAQAMTQAVVPDYIVQFTSGDVRITLRES